MRNKSGQVTIFIILGLVVVVSVIGYFALRGSFFGVSVPEEMRPAYDYYLSCLEDSAEGGIALLGEQGGRIDVGEFSPGSAYMPFSSHLDFFGQGVPYWMYISGNNLLKENVPTKSEMERELGEYIGERILLCDFSDFEAQGFDVYVEEGVASVEVNELNVEVSVNNKITLFKGETSVTVSSHEFEVSSKLGKFFDLALDVYDYEKQVMFLENYAVDVLRLYAPVDGVELGCAPKFFVDEDIREEISDGLVLNIPTIKLEGDYYDLSDKEREYFVEDADFDVDENLNFMYMRDWPTRIEIYGDRTVNAVGTQQGLSALGLCYVPYHLVYDIDFPVMVQFYDEQELFQFPMSVIIDNNQPRKSIDSTFNDVSLEGEVCKYKNSDVTVYTYDSELNPVEARLQFKCLDSICEIGETEIEGSEAVLVDKFPQCVNGFIIADAEGYATAKYQISTNEEDVANIILRKEYDVALDLGDVGEMAVVSFVGEDYSATAVYPEMDKVTLIEGEYKISVYVYEGSTLSIEGYNERMCVDVPVSGIGGLVGLEEEKCYDVNVPSMEVEMAIVGGGTAVDYITESMLMDSAELNLNVPLFGKPSSLDELQGNYEKVEESVLFVEFE